MYQGIDFSFSQWKKDKLAQGLTGIELGSPEDQKLQYWNIIMSRNIEIW